MVSCAISNGRSSGRARGRHPQDNEFTLFGDTIDELSRWHGFSDEGRADRERRLQDIEAELGETEPYRNPFKGVGRNDPCPCGSGKKFKKCCLLVSVSLTANHPIISVRPA